MRINLRSFKKVRETADNATLRDERGHEITLAKKALKPHLIETLSKLPIHLAGKESDPAESEVQDPTLSDPTLQNPANVPQGVLQGSAPGVLPSQAQTSTSNEGVAFHLGHIIGKYGAAPVVKGIRDIIGPEGAIAQGLHGLSNIGQGMTGAMNEAFPESSQPQSNVQPVQALRTPSPIPGQTPSQTEQPISVPTMDQMPNVYGQFQGAKGDVLSGIRGQADIEGKLGEREGQIEGETGQQQQRAFDQYQSDLQDIRNERQNIMKDIADNHINAQHFVENMSVPAKVASAIGILLSGAGAGLTGKDNLAVQYLNNQINRDIDAQKMNLDSKNNLLAANMRKEGNLNAAMTMTRINLNDIMAHRIQEEMGKSAYPMAQFKGKQLAGMYINQNLGLEQQLAMQRAAMRQMQGGQSADPAQQIRMMEMTGIMPKEDAKAATEALGKIKGIEKLRQLVEENAQDLNKQVLAGKLEPGYRASKIDHLAGILGKVAEGRFNLEEAKSQMGALMPAALNSTKTRQSQANARQQFFDALRAEHDDVLGKYQIGVPRAQAIQKFAPVRPGASGE